MVNTEEGEEVKRLKPTPEQLIEIDALGQFYKRMHWPNSVWYMTSSGCFAPRRVTQNDYIRRIDAELEFARFRRDKSVQGG